MSATPSLVFFSRIARLCQVQITKIVQQVQAALITLVEVLKTLIHQAQIALITMEGTAVVGVLAILVLDSLLIKPILKLSKRERK